jgi:poly-beta-1,6-N-acetyl-D-glucosamine synthase
MVLSISVIIISLYGALLLGVYFIFISKSKVPIHSIQEINFEIIVPHRQDEINLKQYLENIKHLEHVENYNWIISEDGNTNTQESSSHIQFIQSNIEATAGKKTAILNAIKHVSKTKVLIHDADIAFHSHHYLEKINKQLSSGQYDLWIGLYELLPSGHYLLDTLQLSENRVLQMITYSFAYLGCPILCSGANMGYSISTFKQSMPYNNNLAILSGDDMFLLSAFKKIKNVKIGSSNDPDLIVQTASKTTWHNYLAQRIRWAGKSKHLQMPLLKGIGALSVAAHLFAVLAWFMFGFTLQQNYLYLILFKTLIELLVGFTGPLKMEKKFTLSSVLLSQFYGAILIYMLIFGIVNTIKWKDRTL